MSDLPPPPPTPAAGLDLAADIRGLATSVTHASDGILASYRLRELDWLPEFKQLRSDAASTLVSLQADVLPTVVQDVQNAMRYLSKLQKLKFEEFEARLEGIVNELTEFIKHSTVTSRLCNQYWTWVASQQEDVGRRATELQKKAAAAAEKAEGERQSGRFYGGLAALAGVACALTGVGALAATAVYAEQLAAGALALGMTGRMAADASGNLLKQAEASTRQAKQLGLAADKVQQHLRPAIDALASVALNLQFFFETQRSGLRASGRRVGLQSQFKLMQGIAGELLQACQELERQCNEAARPLEQVALLAEAAGELQSGLFKPRLDTAA